MSIDIDVIPVIKDYLTISQIVSSIDNEFKNMEFRKLGQERLVKNDERIEPDCAYQVLLEKFGNIVIYVNPTEEDDSNYEVDMIEEYGRNLKDPEFSDIRNSWSEVKLTYRVSSSANRTEKEVLLQKQLAVALADLTKGYIIIPEQGLFGMAIGIYTSTEVNRSIDTMKAPIK